MKTLVIDARDSFTHTIYQYLRHLHTNPEVVLMKTLSPEEILAAQPDFIVLGPGPGHPRDSGHIELVNALADTLPIMGICLGQQAIGMAYGATVTPAEHLMHGKTSPITHDGRGCNAQLPADFAGTRYHSLIVVEETIPEELIITSRSVDDGYVMGLRHREYPLESVQFHPESVMTKDGMSIFESFIDTHVRG